MRRRVYACVLAVAIGGLAAGCDEPLSDLTGPTPDLEPTFSSIQRDIFENGDASGRVACVNCHNTAGRQFAGGLNLESSVAYNNLVNVPSVQRPALLRVAPGDPENSYLIHKVEGRPGIFGQRMPLNSPPLTDGQIRVIRRWIERGAAND